MKDKLFFGLLLLLSVAACKPKADCVEKIDPACICIQLYDPVCGCNNKTYGNACMAGCAGITSYTPGECPGTGTAQLEGPKWRLTQIVVDPEPKSVPDSINIHITLENGQITGSGGCNSIGAAYEAQGNKISVSAVRGTKMYCEGASTWEAMFLERLEKVQTFTVSGNMLELNAGDMGNLVFKKDQL